MNRPLQLTRAEQDAALREHTLVSLGLSVEERNVVLAFIKLWGLVVDGPASEGVVHALAMDLFVRRGSGDG
jgi:hypothetical protein